MNILLNANDLSEREKIDMVAYDGFKIRYIDNPSEAVQLAAVSQIGYANAIGSINKPTEKVQLVAVNQHGSSILFIDNPSEAVQLAAVKQNKLTFKYIKKPFRSVIRLI
jgi:hypothetical protein